MGRVGCHVDGLTYVVPLIYAYDGEAVYVASIEGQKVEMMRANPSVCFEVDEYGPEGWRSAIVHGVYEELGEGEVPTALALLRERFAENGTGRRRSPETHGRSTVCFRIRIRESHGTRGPAVTAVQSKRQPSPAANDLRIRRATTMRCTSSGPS